MRSCGALWRPRGACASRDSFVVIIDAAMTKMAQEAAAQAPRTRRSPKWHEMPQLNYPLQPVRCVASMAHGAVAKHGRNGQPRDEPQDRKQPQ